jgi:hypothetical protein
MEKFKTLREMHMVKTGNINQKLKLDVKVTTSRGTTIIFQWPKLQAAHM